MFRQSSRTILGLFLFLWLAVPHMPGQEPERKALTMWEEQDYRSALEGFRELLNQDPENGDYLYYSGRCLLELNRETENAIELLYRASGKGVPVDVYYYLGLAYFRDYNFQEAEKYFKRFKSEASRQEEREVPVDRMIDGCRSASELTSTYNPFRVINVTFLDLGDSTQYSQIKMKGGELQRKPSDFTIDRDRDDPMTRLMFIPKNLRRGSYVYFAGFSRNDKVGTQLFRARRGPGRSWSNPEEIKSLNSDGDEILPYFDPIEDDLYFASNGREGIGGFDLYKSHYDSERDEWTEPINLGFPVNSVMDEYLLLPGSDLGMVMFFSNRQGTDSTVTVYRVHLAEPKRRTVPGDQDMLQEIAHLGGVADEILAELEQFEAEEIAVNADERGPADRVAEHSAESAPPAAGPEEPAIQSVLAEALQHQAVSDSLKDLAASARARIRQSDDPNERWVWQKQIMVWEKRASDEQELADRLYARVQLREQPASASAPAGVPETIEPDRKVGETTVYRYRDSDKSPVTSGTQQPAGPADGIPPAPDVRTGNGSGLAGAASSHVVSRFEILPSSPYSEKNPIPVDIRLPQGTFYRIQLGAFASGVDPAAFGGLAPITGEWIPERGLYKYYTGKFSSYADASRALSRVHSNGYEDAFIVAWYNGKQVSTQRAKQLE